ncbi:MAG: archaeoflavoprotein AfpA [Desulfatiglans sp.]|jgi:archaeoflavoprotein AfpA|nr:archaeoflavoprotein AfpA [Desulfatiglans sp.]
MTVNIAWGITGAGDLLNEVFDVMEGLSGHDDIKITAIVSKAGESVLKWYKLTERLNSITEKVLIEKDANTPFIAGPLQTGKYQCLVVAPATANTVAKLVHGIADTLLTNCVSMTNKAGREVFILPVDKERGTITTTLPDGKPFQLTMRDIDVDNTEKLRHMKGITVVDRPEEIKRVVKG